MRVSTGSRKIRVRPLAQFRVTPSVMSDYIQCTLQCATRSHKVPPPVVSSDWKSSQTTFVTDSDAVCHFTRLYFYMYVRNIKCVAQKASEKLMSVFWQVFFCVLFAAIALGNVPLSLQAVDQARTAAHYVWDLIDRVKMTFWPIRLACV